MASDMSELWDETAALDHYFEKLEFGLRAGCTDCRPVIKEEIARDAQHASRRFDASSSCWGHRG